MPVQIIFPICMPEVKTTINEDTNLEEETVTFSWFDNWKSYAEHILETHPKDLRATWAKNSLAQSKEPAVKTILQPLTKTSSITRIKQVVIPKPKTSLLERLSSKFIKKVAKVQPEPQKVESQIEIPKKIKKSKLVPSQEQLDQEIAELEQPENPEEVIKNQTITKK